MGPPHASTAASMLAASARFIWIAVTPGASIVAAVHFDVHHHHLSAGIEGQPRSGGAHPGGATNDEHSFVAIREGLNRAICVSDRPRRSAILLQDKHRVLLFRPVTALSVLPHLCAAALPPAKMYVDGKWIDGQGHPLRHRDPVTGEAVFEAPGADEKTPLMKQ